MRNLFIAIVISVFIHAVLFLNPVLWNPHDRLILDVIKAPSSIEAAYIRTEPSVTINTEKLKELAKDDNTIKRPEEEKSTQETADNPGNLKPMIGAITDEISFLMANRPPAYPAIARIKGWEGEVVLEAAIDSAGIVKDVKISSGSGYYVLDNASIRSVKGWRFRNVKRATQIKIPIQFLLTRE